MALNHNTNICIKSEINNKFLRYQAGIQQTYGLLQFSADTLFDPYVQIEVVKTDTSDLVHLKSRYNNKYLARLWPDSNWISASAVVPNQDLSSWACTYFKPILIEEDGDTKKMQLVHVQLGHYATLGTSAPFSNCLFAGSADRDPSKRDVFTVMNWDSVIRFKNSRKVAFRNNQGDKNFLGADIINGRPYLQFSIKDPLDPRAAHEIIPSNNGFIYIKSILFGKYWRLARDDYDKIVVDVKDPPTDEDNNNSLAMFRFSVLQDNRIALLSASKAYYCKRHNSGTNYPNVLAAVTQNVDQYTPLDLVHLD